MWILQQKRNQRITMAEKTKEFEPKWVHVQVTDQDLWKRFEAMAEDHRGGRSAFIRWLIDQEWMRRTKPVDSFLGKDGKK
jgi:hypothetical protein